MQVIRARHWLLAAVVLPTLGTWACNGFVRLDEVGQTGVGGGVVDATFPVGAGGIGVSTQPTAVGGSKYSSTNDGKAEPDPELVAQGYGTWQPGTAPCPTATTASYDTPPVPKAASGCPDIYDSSRAYKPGTTRTVVAPTAPNGASCLTVNCLCGEHNEWEPWQTTACSN